MNTLPNKKELEEAIAAIEPLAENAGFKVRAITASTEEYPILKNYAFGSKAEFVAIDTGREYLLMNVTGNSKSYTIDLFAMVYLASNRATSQLLTATVAKNMTQCLVRSKTNVRQICAHAFGEI